MGGGASAAAARARVRDEKFWTACNNANWSELEELLESGANVNVRGPVRGTTAQAGLLRERG
jgi:hypothetical protein